jgi:hypothetical protein
VSLNETIARLDRDAQALGVELRQRGENVREFNIHPHRLIQYSPGGKGVILVRAFVDDQFECEVVASIERVRELLAVGRRSVTFVHGSGILARSAKDAAGREPQT